MCHRFCGILPVVLFLSGIGVALATLPAQASLEGGKNIFAAKKCGDCHLTVGPSEVKSIADRLQQKGPDLWFAGSKFKAAWLQAWLEQPTPIRGTEWGGLKRGQQQHVHLTADEAAAVAAYLMTLTDSHTKTGVIKHRKRMPKSKQIKAKKLFEKAQACYACHKTPVKKGKKVRRVVGGFTGPTFVGASKRLQADWIYGFLKAPRTYEPFGRMPVYGDQATTKFSDKDLKLLAEYIASF
ncbi:MAG: c-type cytochrome [Dehalococcoidia bacterium]